jgi:hypothetical protein
VVVGGHERGVLARQRPGYMVMDLDLEEKIARKEKSRTGSATGARTVENIGVLGLGYNPNQHNKGRPKKTKKGHQIRCKRSTTMSQVAPASRRLLRRLSSGHSPRRHDSRPRAKEGCARSTHVVGRGGLTLHGGASNSGRQRAPTK